MQNPVGYRDWSRCEVTPFRSPAVKSTRFVNVIVKTLITALCITGHRKLLEFSIPEHSVTNHSSCLS
jgi:hypothetical protein